MTSILGRWRRDDGDTGWPGDDDTRVGDWNAEPDPLTPWQRGQNERALALLIARVGHPDAVARASAVLRAPAGSTTAEHVYGLRAWPALVELCEDCGLHHGPAAVCRVCGASWSVTAEEPLYDHRPGDGDPDPEGRLAGLCFGCGIASASLPPPRPALPAGVPPCAEDGDPGQLEADGQPGPEPAELAGGGPTEPAPALEPDTAAPTPATRRPRRKPAAAAGGD